ncbi:ribosome small subunit-dependent GTPase A [Aureibacillus halotolerans]|uniref:Small ribosomal subunit biogenesis GTPase RsgA n=1 Tax=Aureibacillus halotolerans TaxID=1508390 RepID=A0A4R6UAQ1_9BACI|nr:ribosome small subunit-dependent GTPase A [Aureibacillus halotolerans]TDQ41979.1 ribosome biogenesis GTPase [Aureibacillus halotolerans]
MKLKDLGFQYVNSDESIQEGHLFGRVILPHKHMYRVQTEHGVYVTELTGTFRFEATENRDYPTVGDWVEVNPWPNEKKGSIVRVLPRWSQFSRKVAGAETEEQIVAANINTVLLVMSLNQDFNISRLERYLLLAWESGATPVIVLSKADLCDDIETKIQDVERMALGVRIIVTSLQNNQGIDAILELTKDQQTLALLGSSGAGKSSLINACLGKDVQVTQDIRQEDARGRHTTTHRELLMLPTGGMLIDTPGMRELQLWQAGEGLEKSFADINVFEENCQFRDCTHTSEPGCAVLKAINDGLLEEERLRHYEKYQKELAFLERKQDKRLQQKQTAENKKRAKFLRNHKK